MPRVNPKPLCLEDLSFDYYPSFFKAAVANELYHDLYHEIAWQEEEYTIYGKATKAPRLMAWYGDAGANYNYSGIRHISQPWTATLLSIRASIKEKTGFDFNSVLANLYRDGRDSMGWHADKEKELGENPVIASVSLGAVRKFSLRHNKQKDTLALYLDHGSLLIMQGETQHAWKHALPKTTRDLGPRINLTFRKILTQAHID